jgi:hypothetical protein
VRILGITLLFFACGDDAMSSGPASKPVLGVGTFAGTFDDGAALHGLIGAIADSEGRFSLHLQNQELPFFEANMAGFLYEGTGTYAPIVALSGQAVQTSVALDVTTGNLHAVVRTYVLFSQEIDRTITIDGTLGAMGGSGTFSAMTAGGTTNGHWQLAPGIPLDAGRPMPPDAMIDAPEVDAPMIDAPEIDAGVD